jgi:hypothetical protein
MKQPLPGIVWTAWHAAAAKFLALTLRVQRLLLVLGALASRTRIPT